MSLLRIHIYVPWAPPHIYIDVYIRPLGFQGLKYQEKELKSIRRNSIIMICKGYHYVFNLGIISNFYISVDSVCPESCARGSIVVGELRGIWVLPSP